MKKNFKVFICFSLFFLFFVSIGCKDNVETYSVKFVDGNIILKNEVVEEGKSATAPDLPIKEGYDFIKWDKDFTNIQDNLVVNAVYKIKTFYVTFLDSNKNVINEQTVKYGESAIAPDSPTLEGYTFIGWDADFTYVKSNLTVTALYEKNVVTANIKYYDGDDELDLNPKIYNVGYGIQLPIPTKEYYEFIGWFLADYSLTEYTAVDTSMEGDLVFYAKFLEVDKATQITLPESTYKITKILNVEYQGNSGLYIYRPEIPKSAPSTSIVSYTWETSDSNIATISQYGTITAKGTGYCVLTGTLISNSSVTLNCFIKVSSEGIECATEEEVNTITICNVIFKGKNGEIIKIAKCQKGGNVIYPVPPVYDGYTFTGWDKVNYNIKSDTIITATYKEGSDNYTGKSFSIIGDSISTYSGYIPSTFSAFYPCSTADVSDVNKTWWMQVINRLGGTLFSNNSYSGTCAAIGTNNATSSIERLQYTILNGQMPDVILIFIGSNDCASKYVTLDNFDKGYKQMLDILKELCPISEIILCTLPDSSFYTSTNKDLYNDIIRNYASFYNFKLIELENVSLNGKLVDSAHPMTSGMSALAEKMISEILK